MLDRVVNDKGLEAIFCGEYEEDPSCSAYVHDFVRYGQLNSPWSCTGVESHLRDIYANIQANRDRHYKDLRRTMAEIDLSGQTVVLMAPGPSLKESIVDHADKWKSLDFSNVFTVAINRAVGFVHTDFAFITERSAREEWLRHDQLGYLAPWIPEVPLVTCPDASGWLADLWEPDNRFYAWIPYISIPEDKRAKQLSNLDNTLWSYWHTPVMALHFAVKRGAKKVVLLGHDYCLSKFGEVYPDVPANAQPQRWDKRATVGVGHDGRTIIYSLGLAYYRNIMRACCYWCERNGTPVLNATPTGTLDWRVTPIEKALSEEFETIVDFESGVINGPYSGDPGFPAASVPGEVERSQLQPA